MGQLWEDSGNGFLASDILSDDFRCALQPITRFRQFCDVENAVGKNAGEVFSWSIMGDTADEGGEIQESQKMPETTFPITNASVTMTEFGLSVPFTAKFDDLSTLPVKTIVNKTMKNNANRALDRTAHAQFDATILKAVGGASGAITLTDTGTASGANNIAMSTDHVKTLADLMQERNIPSFDGEDYVGIARPTTWRPVKTELEDVNKYVDEGWKQIVNGEIGRYESIRFVNQTNIASEGWSNGLSDAAYFFGADTVTEAIAIPEELRGKIPDDYGRGRGLAWYYLGNFGITHADTTSAETKAQARIIKWDSTS